MDSCNKLKRSASNEKAEKGQSKKPSKAEEAHPLPDPRNSAYDSSATGLTQEDINAKYHSQYQYYKEFANGNTQEPVHNYTNYSQFDTNGQYSPNYGYRPVEATYNGAPYCQVKYPHLFPTYPWSANPYEPGVPEYHPSSNEHRFDKPCKILPERHHESNEAEYACSASGCVKVLKRLSTLRLHTLSHFYEAHIFVCPSKGCTAGYKSLAAVKDHIGMVHPESRYQLLEQTGKDKGNAQLRMFLALKDFYAARGVGKENVFERRFCFGCFEYQIDRHRHMCHKGFSKVSVCPACDTVIEGSLESHVNSDVCKRNPPNIKDSLNK